MIDNGFATANHNMTLVAGNSAAFSSGGMSLKGGSNSSRLAILNLNGYSFSFANLTSGNQYAQITSGSAAATITVGSDGTTHHLTASALVNGSSPLGLAKVQVRHADPERQQHLYRRHDYQRPWGLSLANSAALTGSGNITFGGGTLQYNAASSNQDYSTNSLAARGQSPLIPTV